MQVRVHDERHAIITLEGLLPPEECDALIASTEAMGFGDAPITTFGGFEMRPEVRNNTRVMFDDAARARRLWAHIDHVPPARRHGWRAHGLNERFRVYRYEPGQYFNWHRDGAFERTLTERSMLTFMVYLNEGFDGGATEFDDGPVVTPRRGMGLLFLHGLRHRGAPVKAGVKYVLRSDVMYTRE